MEFIDFKRAIQDNFLNITKNTATLFETEVDKGVTIND